MDENLRRTLETMERVKNNEPYVYSRCIAISENAVSFDVEMYWMPVVPMRGISYNSTKANVVVTKSLQVSLSYPYHEGRPFAEKEKWLIEHCIERAKVIFSI